MSFWSSIGKIGALVAAPFTGGASLAAMPAIDALGKATGAAAANRGAADTEQLRRDQLALEGRQQLENMLASRSQRDLAERNAAKADLYRANYAQNWKPAQRPGNVPMISFSQGPGTMLQEALGRQASDSSARLQHPMFDISGAPKLGLWTPTPPKKPSIWERFGNIASFAAPIVGGLMGRGNGNGDLEQQGMSADQAQWQD